MSDNPKKPDPKAVLPFGGLEYDIPDEVILKDLEDYAYVMSKLKDCRGVRLHGTPFEWVYDMFDYETADAVIERIIDDFAPEKIIVFGSVARHGAGDHSDLDILVIMDTALEGAKRAAAIHSHTSDFMMPLDILVLTPSEFEANMDSGYSFASEIVSTGIIAYDAARIPAKRSVSDNPKKPDPKAVPPFGGLEYDLPDEFIRKNIEDYPYVMNKLKDCRRQ